LLVGIVSNQYPGPRTQDPGPSNQQQATPNMQIISWISDNYIEIFGAVTGILYVFLEIRQNIWLWPVGIATSAVYIIVFFTNKFYADMSLQGYYLVISVLGWYWWMNGRGRRAEGGGLRAQDGERSAELQVTRLKVKTGITLLLIWLAIYAGMWFVLDRFTDSPVPAWDSFITSLSIVATWMLARKIYEHWYLWLIVNAAAVLLFITRGLYPTVILYSIYFAMSFAGLRAWKRSL
jgi:nicotinamide mononucleotide transporter